MVVLDTHDNVDLIGHISVALEMLRAGQCDEIITQGEHFTCYKREDKKIGEIIRKRSLSTIGENPIRYIFVANEDSTGNRVCLSDTGDFVPDFKRARYAFDKASAEEFLTHLAQEGYSNLRVEEYLYREALHCSLRIYYQMSGVYTDKGLLGFIRSQLNKGILSDRVDSRGKRYILLEDLLIFKSQLIRMTNSNGVSYSRIFDLKILLHDGLIAFDVVRKFAEKHPELNIPEMQHLIKKDTATQCKFYDLGAVFYTDKTIQDISCAELCLDEWR